MAVSVKIGAELKGRVESLANLRKRSPHWIMQEAISEYVSREEARESFYAEAMASWTHYQETGLHLTLAEVSAWLKTWGSEAETEAPACHT